MKYSETSKYWPPHSVQGERLGRYEYVQGSSQKFYHVMVDTSGGYWGFFGRIGSKNPQFRRFQSGADVARVLSHKRQKGYVFVPGSATSELQCLQERQQELERLLPAAASEAAAPSRRPRM